MKTGRKKEEEKVKRQSQYRVARDLAERNDFSLTTRLIADCLMSRLGGVIVVSNPLFLNPLSPRKIAKKSSCVSE